ncbi:benzoate carboxyl methyltransferase-like [Vitis riparia]|uniref:benzoate carboxyl methyltransferase-like n=1 Tax=Vitis riparia TaxID=96939 RepID=UPI00155A6414|nr:benzoate carboxyl methyltransferase-like [Vitis riparia]
MVQEEGSFNLDKLVTFEASWDPFDESDKYRGALNVANYMRSIAEPTLTGHFGGTIIGNLFGRYCQYSAAMVFVKVLHMNGGSGKTSYAKKKMILEARPFLEDSIKDAFSSGIPSCVKLSDLGCSSGPNALSAISEIIHTIHGMSKRMDCKLREFLVSLNDLPGNDFNNIFSPLPDFYKKLKKEEDDTLGHCFITEVPGSFHGRIFPSRSLDFLHSSCKAHWLSQAPAGLEKNKGHIYIANGSPPTVIQAYTNQFQRDFSLFLGLRSEEIKPGGCSSEGEVRTMVQEEGSFNLDKLETFEASWDPFDESYKYRGAQNVANCIRIVTNTEPTLATHFGGTII